MRNQAQNGQVTWSHSKEVLVGGLPPPHPPWGMAAQRGGRPLPSLSFDVCLTFSLSLMLILFSF